MIRTSTLALVTLMTASFSAHAIGVQLTQPVKSEIEVKPAELILKKEKSFNCALEGFTESGWQDTIDLKITANSLEDAAELSLTPYVVVEPSRENDSVKIKVDGQNFLVRKVNCRAITRSI